jgi:hypothetical protein
MLTSDKIERPYDDEAQWCRWVLQCNLSTKDVVLKYQSKEGTFVDLLQLPYRYAREHVEVGTPPVSVLLAHWLQSKGEPSKTQCHDAANTVLALIHCAHEEAICRRVKIFQLNELCRTCDDRQSG